MLGKLVASNNNAPTFILLVIILKVLSAVLLPAVALISNEVVVSEPTETAVPVMAPLEDIENPEPDKFEVVSA